MPLGLLGFPVGTRTPDPHIFRQFGAGPATIPFAIAEHDWQPTDLLRTFCGLTSPLWTVAHGPPRTLYAATDRSRLRLGCGLSATRRLPGCSQDCRPASNCLPVSRRSGWAAGGYPSPPTRLRWWSADDESGWPAPCLCIMLFFDPAVQVVDPVHDPAPHPEAVRADTQVCRQYRNVATGVRRMSAASLNVSSWSCIAVFTLRVCSTVRPASLALSASVRGSTI